MEHRPYQDACDKEEDPEIQSIERQMSDLIRTLDDGSVSFDSFKVVTETYVYATQDVERVLLDCKEDIQGNKEVFDLLGEFIEGSKKTLELCDAFKKGLLQVRDSFRLIVGALHQYEEDTIFQGGNSYQETFEELKKVKGIQNPFGEDFMKIFQSVYKQQTQMLEKLEIRKNELDKKLKHHRELRKLFPSILVATFSAATISFVLAVAMAASPVAAVLTGAVTMSIVPGGQFLESELNNYEKMIKGHKDVVVSMRASTDVAVKALDMFKTLIKKLDDKIEGMVKSAEDAVEENAVKQGIKEIREKLKIQRSEWFG